MHNPFIVYAVGFSLLTDLYSVRPGASGMRRRTAPHHLPPVLRSGYGFPCICLIYSSLIWVRHSARNESLRGVQRGDCAFGVVCCRYGRGDGRREMDEIKSHLTFGQFGAAVVMAAAWNKRAEPHPHVRRLCPCRILVGERNTHACRAKSTPTEGKHSTRVLPVGIQFRNGTYLPPIDIHIIQGSFRPGGRWIARELWMSPRQEE
ncbi:hypothetical protein K438DRAFT_803413 [Mycena galopus ATCC 62051]|nr:hypothetical protein K438DRAFT_803413 [Mycena galopus ATCC 62051]